MPTRDTGPFGVVVLAAGGSSRMGRAKGLLPFLGRTLVEHAARVALASGASEVVVVIGAEAPAMRARLAGLPVRIVHNDAWAEGMGGSLRAGIAALSTGVASAVVALADQPRMAPAHLRALAAHLETEGVPIVASLYDGVLGAPCAFARGEFPRLLALSGDVGARHLIRSGDAPVATLAFAGANFDVDTPAEYAALIAAAPADAPSEGVGTPDDPRGPPTGALVPSPN